MIAARAIANTGTGIVRRRWMVTGAAGGTTGSAGAVRRRFDLRVGGTQELRNIRAFANLDLDRIVGRFKTVVALELVAQFVGACADAGVFRGRVVGWTAEHRDAEDVFIELLRAAFEFRFADVAKESAQLIGAAETAAGKHALQCLAFLAGGNEIGNH
jgi:hypothetical protein